MMKFKHIRSGYEYILRKWFKIPKRLAIYSLCIGLLAVTVAWPSFALSRKTFYEGVTLEGVALSGLDKAQAKSWLEKKLRSMYYSQNLALAYEDRNWSFPPEEIGLSFSVEEAVDAAYAIGRTGSVWQRLSFVYSAYFDPIHLSIEPAWDERKLTGLLQDIKKQVDKEAKNAAVAYKNGNIQLNKDEIGYVLDIDVNKKLIENSIRKRNFSGIELQVDKVYPQIRYADISAVSDVLATFTTVFNPQDQNRTHNIRLACNRINGIILMPNDLFSMNRVLGPRTLENGYKEAPVIFMNELIKGPGGGICQVTTTLYDAVLKSKLEVLERVHHTLPLGYVDLGQDATIAEDYIDFKFQNNRDSAVAILPEIAGNTIVMRIVGKPDAGAYVVKLKSVVLEEYLPEPDDMILDDSVPDNEKIVVKEAKKGYKVVVYRDTYNKNGELLEREKISEDTYKPVRGQVKVNGNHEEILE